MRHCVLVCMDATVCNIACRLTNWSRWYNAWITNGTLACQVLTGKVKKCKNWPQWDKRVAHRPLEWSSENQIMSLCWSAVHALTQRSTSIWKGYACPYNCLFLCKVTFSDSPPPVIPHILSACLRVTLLLFYLQKQSCSDIVWKVRTSGWHT